MNSISILMGIFNDARWPVAVSIVLIAILLVWMMRYRQLYLKGIEIQKNAKNLIDNLSEGIYRSSLEGKLLSANKALVALNGYKTEAEMLKSVQDIGVEWYIEPGRRDEFRTILHRDGFVKEFISEIYRHKTRERIWISESARIVYDKKTGDPLFYEGSVREVTETVKKLRLKTLLKNLSDQVPGGLFQFSHNPGSNFSFSYISDGFRQITGFQGSEAEFNLFYFLRQAHKDDRDVLLKSFREAGQKMQPCDQEFRILEREKETWLRVTAAPEAFNGTVFWYGYISDISVRKNSETEIRKLAFYDALTGLSNRHMFMQRINKAVEKSQQRSACGAVIFIDLDNFKALNDTCGHVTGDDYLVQVSNQLQQCIRDEDLVARIGGDEFVILLENIGDDYASSVRSAIMTANRVLSVMRSNFELDQFRHRSSASLGVVVFGAGQSTPDEILKQADIAMYRVKAAGKNGIALYDHVSMGGEVERYRLLDDLKTALYANALELYYQPKLNNCGRIVGAEALCRWQHDELGMLMAKRFVPLTRQFGLIREFDNAVLKQGAAMLANWQENPATAGLQLAININILSILDEDFVPDLGALLNRHGVKPANLTLELIESVMIKDKELVINKMRALKELGVRLSLDDFGSAYLSLTLIKQMPFDELKIDGGFISDIENDENDRALVKSMLSTAKTLKLAAVAKHVANECQEAFLRTYDCDYFQGYLYSRALPAKAFIEFVKMRQTDNAARYAIRQRHSA